MMAAPSRVWRVGAAPEQDLTKVARDVTPKNARFEIAQDAIAANGIIRADDATAGNADR